MAEYVGVVVRVGVFVGVSVYEGVIVGVLEDAVSVIEGVKLRVIVYEEVGVCEGEGLGVNVGEGEGESVRVNVGDGV